MVLRIFYIYIVTIFLSCRPRDRLLEGILLLFFFSVVQEIAFWKVYCYYFSFLLSKRSPSGRYIVTIFLSCRPRDRLLEGILLLFFFPVVQEIAFCKVYCYYFPFLSSKKSPSERYVVSLNFYQTPGNETRHVFIPLIPSHN
jgi:hypothetical protein